MGEQRKPSDEGSVNSADSSGGDTASVAPHCVVHNMGTGDMAKKEGFGDPEGHVTTPDQRPPPKPMHPIIWKLMIVSLVFIYSSYTILVHICEVDGKLPFNTASVVLVTEILKLCLSILMFVPEYRSKGFEVPSLRLAWPFAIPAILYCINNNVGLHMQLEMDPATYQVLCNLKILSTAVLYRLIIKRPITNIQWVSLFMLAMAGASNSYGGLMAKGSETTAGNIHITVKGLVMIFTYCTISGLSGVYSEYILKDKYEMSIHIQNGLLYIFGVFLNGSLWFVTTLSASEPINIFQGYSGYTCLLILSQASCGLIMSSVMKHGNNIIRLFIISSAMMVTMVLSILIFNLQLNIYICVAFVLVVAALALYHSK